MATRLNKIIGVDFDGTLAITKGTYPKIQGPMQEIIDYVKSEQAAGAYVILITMREFDELKQAVAWCKEQGLHFDAVNDNLEEIKQKYQHNSRKITADLYLDDKAQGVFWGLEP
jgi:hypothetical protein